MVALVTHGHTDRPVKLRGTQHGNEPGDRSIATGNTKALSQDGAAKLGNGASMSYGRMHFIACIQFFMTSLGTPHAFGAELFPFSPPTSQQRAVDQPRQLRPQLSKEDITRATRLADRAKKLTLAEQQEFRENIQRKQKDAVRDGSFAQAQYYTELLTQLRQENR